MGLAIIDQTSLSPEDEHKRAARRLRLPERMTIELTTACQLSCEHCYNFDRDERQPTDTLSFETVCRVLDEAEALGVLRLELTGGEATLHPRLADAIRYAKSRHFWVLLKTHGAISPTKFESFIEAGIDELSVSLYGSEKIHDSFTGVRGSWAKTNATIFRAIEVGVKVSVSLVLHARNFDTILDLQKSLVEMGIEARIGKVIHPRHVGGDVDDAIKLSYEDWFVFYEAQYEGKPPSSDVLPKREKRSFRCDCALSSFAVASNGSVYPCIGVPWIAGSIYDTSLEDIWRSSQVFEEIRGLRPDDFAHCQACDIKKYCERIAPSAYLGSGIYTGFEPSQCVQAQAHHDYARSKTTD